jgi:ubiquinone biosynthesis protein Coq4
MLKQINMRDIIIEKLYEATRKPYQLLFKKNQPWLIDRKELLKYPVESLGFNLGCFLLKHDFELQDQFEDHDVIHVLTQTNVATIDEIGMQYYLFGNGKRSFYLLLVLVTGLLFYPFQINYFFKEYKRGKIAYQFHHLDFCKMLYLPVATIREAFAIQK